MRTRGLQESVMMALGTLREHKFRSFLTLLGVLVGTITVMVIASFIAGLDQKFKEEIQVLGSNTIFVAKFDPGIHTGRLTPEERMRKPITYDDGVAIEQLCPSVQYVAPVLGPGGLPKIRYEGQELYVTQVQGTTSDFSQMATVQVGEGRFFSQAEDQHHADVCVIGFDVADKLFAHMDPIGKTLLVDNQPLTVIGVLQKQENFFAGDGSDANQNKAVYTPYETMHKMYPQEKEDFFLMVQPYPNKGDEAIEEIRQVLRRRRNVPFEKADNFGIATPEGVTAQFHQITAGIAILMFVISSVGLMIGGIGVMNIMLVSVTERTREIGVRKAIGARRRDIIWQFLIEAMTLTGAGGLLGIFLGWLVSLLVKLILPAYVPPWAPIVGFCVSVGIGLVFGIWPAMKASRLDPIDALRYE